MATKGEGKAQKSISVSKVRLLKRKKRTWTIKTGKGPHTKGSAVPLGFVIRDMLNLARTKREARIVLNTSVVTVDGIRRKEIHFPVGLFDSIGIEKLKKAYRVVFDRHGRIKMNEIEFSKQNAKLCKIVRKHTVSGNKIQLTLNDGTNLLEKNAKDSLAVGTSVKLELPNRKVLEKYAMEKGNLAYVVSGTHSGKMAKIAEVFEGTQNKPKLVTLDDGNEKFQTVEKYVIAIGKEKPAIELGEIA